MLSAAYAVDIGETFPLAQNFPTIASLVTELFPRILLVAGIIFFVLVIGAGIRVISTAGSDDPHSQEQAKNFLTLSLTGLIIIFGSFWILQIINYLTNKSLINLIK